ncbi:MAG: type II secretion system F family protein [Deltaproteobacteria bacterium]|nr:type II secretion system F family protein [Desulfitobacteriaceae bacterium]MDI6855086.1 type II secretion system F family protein [Deltaproteobacteria bacterium]
MLWVIWGTVFFAVFLLTFTVTALWGRRQRVKERMETQGPVSGASTTLLRPTETAHPVAGWFIDWFAKSGQYAMGDLKKVSELRRHLIIAGFRNPKAPAVYFGLKLISAFLLPLPILLFFIIKGKVTPIYIMMAFSFSLLGFILPTKLLDFRVNRRQERLDKALPDILDLFVICMEAGLALNATINRVADEVRNSYKEFSDELLITSTEVRTGIPWDEAFDNLARRTEVQSVKSMVALIIQSDRLGASIATALRNHSEFVRTQRILRAEEKAAKLPIKMIFPLLFCIFPAIIIVVVGPGIIHIADKFLGFYFKGQMAPGTGQWK